MTQDQIDRGRGVVSKYVSRVVCVFIIRYLRGVGVVSCHVARCVWEDY